MNKKLALLSLLICLAVSGYSQDSVNDYNFVSVPSIFEFLNETDKYQLNSMTKYLFNKSGFNAYLENELPNVRRCEGLYATVEGSPGIIYTKITVILKDCNGQEIFRGLPGKSKIKEYKRSYQQALRRAFESVEALGANQGVPMVDDLEEPVVYPVVNEMKVQKDEVIEDNPMSSGTGTRIDSSPTAKIPSAKFSSYSANGKSYLLRKTDDGFALYEESTVEKDGLKLLGVVESVGNGYQFTDADGNQSDAIFDAVSNLKIVLNGNTLMLTAN